MQGVQGDYEMQPQLVQMELDQGGGHYKAKLLVNPGNFRSNVDLQKLSLQNQQMLSAVFLWRSVVLPKLLRLTKLPRFVSRPNFFFSDNKQVCLDM